MGIVEQKEEGRKKGKQKRGVKELAGRHLLLLHSHWALPTLKLALAPSQPMCLLGSPCSQQSC